MQIENKSGIRILTKHDNEQINVSDGSIIQYTGIYYKVIKDIVNIVEIQTTFIGEVECKKYRFDEGITGVFVKPLYIFDSVKSKWCKIIDYLGPRNKYFFYPHLLSLPNYNHYSKPLDFLNTCSNISLEEFKDVTDTFSLNIDSLPY
jgi:hypothetical protein